MQANVKDMKTFPNKKLPPSSSKENGKAQEEG